MTAERAPDLAEARRLTARGELDAAAALLAALRADGAADDVALTEAEAQLAYRRLDNARARTALEHVLARDPDRTSARLLLARVALRTGAAAEARAHAEAVLLANPADADAQLIAARAAVATGDAARGAELFAALAARRPADIPLRLQLLEALVRAGDLAAARTAAAGAARDNPDAGALLAAWLGLADPADPLALAAAARAAAHHDLALALPRLSDLVRVGEIGVAADLVAAAARHDVEDDPVTAAVIAMLDKEAAASPTDPATPTALAARLRDPHAPPSEQGTVGRSADDDPPTADKPNFLARTRLTFTRLLGRRDTEPAPASASGSRPPPVPGPASSAPPTLVPSTMTPSDADLARVRTAFAETLPALRAALVIAPPAAPLLSPEQADRAATFFAFGFDPPARAPSADETDAAGKPRVREGRSPTPPASTLSSYAPADESDESPASLLETIGRVIVARIAALPPGPIGILAAHSDPVAIWLAGLAGAHGRDTRFVPLTPPTEEAADRLLAAMTAANTPLAHLRLPALAATMADSDAAAFLLVDGAEILFGNAPRYAELAATADGARPTAGGYHRRTGFLRDRLFEASAILTDAARLRHAAAPFAPAATMHAADRLGDALDQPDTDIALAAAAVERELLLPGWVRPAAALLANVAGRHVLAPFADPDLVARVSSADDMARRELARAAPRAQPEESPTTPATLLASTTTMLTPGAVAALHGAARTGDARAAEILWAVRVGAACGLWHETAP